jgi:hypothetical protein
VLQGDYIRHPVLYELSHKYGLQHESDPDSAALPCRLDELKEHIRREIRKELKIKEGAEKLREVAKDRRSLADVATIVKKANTKLAELQAELQELESQIILTQGQTAPSSPPVPLSNGQGQCHFGHMLVRLTSLYVKSRSSALLGSQMALILLGLHAHACYPLPLSRPQGHCAARRIRSIEKFGDLIGKRTRKLPACNVLPLKRCS